MVNNETENRFAETFNIVFTGNVGIPQNLGVLVEAAKHIKDYEDIRFIIVGDGDYLADFKNEISKNALQDMFVFEGRKPFNQMNDYYSVADCLFASLKSIPLFEKIIPAKIQAYMQAGKPILCAINGESAQIIKDAECGLCSKAADANELAVNIEKLYKMPKEIRAKMGEKGIIYSEVNFNREKLLDKLAKILSE
jgi:glycosyltransferase involved in cell wall biosynthesis